MQSVNRPLQFYSSWWFGGSVFGSTSTQMTVEVEDGGLAAARSYGDCGACFTVITGGPFATSLSAIGLILMKW